MKYLSLLLVPFLILSFYGCSPKAVSPERPVVAPEPAGQGAGQAGLDKGGSRGISEEDMATRAERERMERLRQERLDAESRSALMKDIRFEYDSYAINADDLARLRDIARWLSRNSAILTVEGHCDERGTQEYNLMLGQKRAEVVKDYLVKAGVDPARVKAVSFGKEAPLDPGHTEEAWAKNRRAHLNVDQKG